MILAGTVCLKIVEPINNATSAQPSDDEELPPSTIHSSQIASLNSQPVGSLHPPPIDNEKASSNSGFTKPHAYLAQQNLTTSSHFVNSHPTPTCIIPEEANFHSTLTQHRYPAEQKLTAPSNFA